MCLRNSGPTESSKVEKDRDPVSRPYGWTTLELTSSWLAMYLGSYFDRRYHCERGDKLLQGSLWRRCVPPWACSDSHQPLSTPLLSLPCSEQRIVGGLFGWELGLYWQGPRGSGYHRPRSRASKRPCDSETGQLEMSPFPFFPPNALFEFISPPKSVLYFHSSFLQLYSKFPVDFLLLMALKRQEGEKVNHAEAE